MSRHFIALNHSRHKDFKIKTDPAFAHAKCDNLIPLVVQEVVDAATEFPIVFVKNANTGELELVSIMGVQAKQNLYCSGETFGANYAPLALRLYPFSLQAGSEALQMMVCIDESSDLVNTQAGEPLFDAQEQQTPFLQKTSKLLVEYQEQLQITRAFINMLIEHELLVPQTLKLTLKSPETSSIEGIYVIDQEKLNQLSDQTWLKMRKNGALEVIQAHLLSLKQFGRLLKLAGK